MSADLTPQQARKLSDAELVEHMNTYRGGSGAQVAAFNESQRRHALRVRFQSGVVSGVVSVIVHVLLKLFGM